jgi:hypothetical protein
MRTTGLGTRRPSRGYSDRAEHPAGSSSA